MKTKIVGGIILLALIIGGIYLFAQGKDELVMLDTQDESSTELAPTAGTDQEVEDTRTPEQIMEEEGSAEIVGATDTSVDESGVETSGQIEIAAEGELIGQDAVAPVRTPGEVSYTVLGSNFAYDITEMRVQEGDVVTVTFRSVDGFHDWVVDEFDAATQKVSTGNETTVTFTADKKGTYEYYCSVGSHRANGMVGTLIVE